MKRLTHISLLSVGLLLAACGGEEKSTEDSILEMAEELVDEVSIPGSPCDWINADDLRSIMDVPTEFEISMEAKDYTYPACSFRWEDEKVVKSMDMGGRTMEMTMPSEVMVVLATEITPEKFQRSVKVYQDGEAVDGVGDEAMWGDQMHQLSFRKGSVMLHVNVKADNDNAVNKANALKIADFLLEKM